jgi:glycosyltransferase involved in cell wall biosynthesis
MQISVIIPAYNAAAYIERALRSVLNQSRPAGEIIVINDGSTDGTSGTLKRYAGKIRIIEQANAGVSAARNAGIRAAAGDWIAFLDADDEWLPEKLAKQSQFHQNHPDLKWSSANYYRCICSRNHQQIQDVNLSLQLDTGENKIFDDYFGAFGVLAKGHTDTMLIWKAAILEAGLFYEPQKTIEDDDLWFRLGYLNLRFGFLREPLAIYHLGPEQSITKKFIEPQWIDLILSRQIPLAARAGKTDSFNACARQLLGYWIYNLLMNRQSAAVRMLLRKYGFLLTPYCRRTSYIGSLCPGLWKWNETRKHLELK